MAQLALACAALLERLPTARADPRVVGARPGLKGVGTCVTLHGFTRSRALHGCDRVPLYIRRRRGALHALGWVVRHVAPTRTLIRKAIREPWRVPRALAARLFPASRWGMDWVRGPDGSVTFRGGGFVAAPTPEMLLARHNFELLQIQHLLEGRSFERSLEVGCGFGRLSPHYAKYSASHVAVDINDEALSVASISYPGIDFRHASAMDLPFSDQEFDLVSTWTVLQHIPPRSIERAAHELDRVLSPRGTLLICEETRLANDSSNVDAWHAHTWHRSVASYRALFSSLMLVSDSYIDELDHIPSMASPGRVMLFQRGE